MQRRSRHAQVEQAVAEAADKNVWVQAGSDISVQSADVLYFERAQNYRAQGKAGMARKDLERILAEDSEYEGVREQLDRMEP